MHHTFYLYLSTKSFALASVQYLVKYRIKLWWFPKCGELVVHGLFCGTPKYSFDLFQYECQFVVLDLV